MQSLHTTLFLLSPNFGALLFNQNEQFGHKTKIISSLGNKLGLRAKVAYQKVSPHCGFSVWNSILACHCGAIPCCIRAAAAFVCRAIVLRGSQRHKMFSWELVLPAPSSLTNPVRFPPVCWDNLSQKIRQILLPDSQSKVTKQFCWSGRAERLHGHPSVKVEATDRQTEQCEGAVISPQ